MFRTDLELRKLLLLGIGDAVEEYPTVAQYITGMVSTYIPFYAIPFARKLEEAGTPCRVVDLGCGYGLFPRFMERLGHEVFSCDLMINSTRANFRNWNFLSITDDELREWIPSGDPPYLNCTEVLEHIPRNVAPALKRIIDVLTPQAMMITAGTCAAHCPSIGEFDSLPTFEESPFDPITVVSEQKGWNANELSRLFEYLGCSIEFKLGSNHDFTVGAYGVFKGE